MKSFTIASIIAALAASAIAVPQGGPIDPPRTFITFKGAADGQYTETLVCDGKTFIINDPLSISQIQHDFDRCDCTFYGKDKSITHLGTATSVDVGPPQPQVSGVCKKLPDYIITA